MPVSTESSISGPYTPNGATTDFAFDFKATSADEVVALDEDGVLISTALYSVELDEDEGGTLSFSVAPTLSQYSEIYVASEPAFTQPSDFDNAGPSFNPAALTRALDRAAVRDLKQQLLINRSLKLPFGDDDVVLPGVDQRKGKALVFDAATGLPGVESLSSVFDGSQALLATSRSALAGLTGVSSGQSAALGEGVRAGLFRFDDSDLSSEVMADTAQGLYVAPTSDATGASGAWVRQYTGPVFASWFGAAGDGVTDDTAALQAWADSGAPILQLGKGTFLISDTLTIPHGFKILDTQGGTITYTGTQDRTAVVVGSTSTSNAGIVRLGSIRSNVRSDWTNSDYIGVLLYNFRQAQISYEVIFGFTENLVIWADNVGFAYNTVQLGLSTDAAVHVRLHGNSASSGTPGFVNENKFIKGRINSSSGVLPTEDAYGVVFSAGGASPYLSHNNNHFDDLSVELLAADPGVLRVPIFFDGAGRENRFTGLRAERNQGPVAICDGSAVTDNQFGIGFIDGSEQLETVIETDGAVRNFLRSPRPYLSGLPQWSSGPLRDRISAYDASNAYITGDMHFLEGSAPSATSAGIEYREKSVEFGSRGVAVMVDTRERKSFAIRVDGVDNSGRVFVQGYDASGAIISNATAYVSGAFSTTASYGGGFQTGLDNLEVTVFTVTDAVKSLRVGVAGGTARADVRSFTVIGLDEFVDAPMSCFSGLQGDRFARFCASGGPTSGKQGSYRRGEMIYNAAAASAAPIGYPCLTTGYLADSWAISTAYNVGDLRLNGSNVYVVRTAGTSAGSGGPTGTGTAISDGGVVWDYYGPKATFGTGPNIA